MVKISKRFPGGNIKVLSQTDHTVYLDVELRDTQGDWFYWAFKVSGAEGQTLKFVFTNDYVGYFGAAISYDLKEWKWQYDHQGHNGNTFTYTFGKDEKEVHFAHNFVYTAERFYEFARTNGIKTEVLALTKKGREIPFVKFGEGKKHIMLTSRHHACESTGSYVLEGVLKELYNNPIPDTTVFCVPMVDLDGVVDGDQGKNRAPYDHNRDYDIEKEPIYSSTKEICKYANENNVVMAADFHSPWHLGDINDKVVLVKNSINGEDDINAFSDILEEKITPDSLKYFAKDNMPANQDWNWDNASSFNKYIARQKGCRVAVVVETCYFGEQDNIFSDAKAVEFGKCFAEAIREKLI